MSSAAARSAPFDSCVFVTGANGWLGRRLVAALKGMNPDGAVGTVAPRDVCALVLPGEPTRDLLAMGAKVTSGDIRDTAAIAEFLRGAEGATVIHLAGVIHPASGRTQTFFDVNVSGTRHLAERATACRVRRLVVMSSNSPFGANGHPNAVFDETSPYQPYMAYGRSKKAMEELLLRRADAREGPEIVILRAPWFYGPEQPLRQTRFFAMIRRGRFPIVGSGENRRSMAYVDNLSTGILLAAASPRAAGQAYWLADARSYSMNEIVETVRKVLTEDFGLNAADRQMRVPSVVSDLARVVDASLQKTGFYQQEIHVLSEMNLTIACSIKRAREELGYLPLIELREGMRRSVGWCLERGIAI